MLRIGELDRMASVADFDAAGESSEDGNSARWRRERVTLPLGVLSGSLLISELIPGLAAEEVAVLSISFVFVECREANIARPRLTRRKIDGCTGNMGIDNSSSSSRIDKPVSKCVPEADPGEVAGLA